MPRTWVHSIYHRVGFTVRDGTTSRPPVPYGLYHESRITYLRGIAEKIKAYSIPPELMLNADQTPSAFVPVGYMTLAEKGVSNVPIKGKSDKRNNFNFRCYFRW